MLSDMASIVSNEHSYRADLLRGEKGRLDWTDQDIADKSGVSVPTVRAILRGETNVRFANIMKVARALGVTLQQLSEPEPETVGASQPTHNA